MSVTVQLLKSYCYRTWKDTKHKGQQKIKNQKGDSNQ